jgi:hypothetical protein
MSITKKYREYLNRIPNLFNNEEFTKSPLKEEINKIDFDKISDELYDILGSSIHSAKIKKGLECQRIILNILHSSGYNASAGRTIKFSNLPVGNSQKKYKVDIFVKTETEIWLIDAKGDSWNNNTPMSDTLKKYQLAKKEIQNQTTKKVRFILLKNTNDDYQFNYLKNIALPYGIEFILANPFLSEISKKEVNLNKMSKEFYRKKIIENIKSNIN